MTATRGGRSPHGLSPTRVRQPQKWTLNGVTYITKYATLNGVTHEKSYPKWREQGNPPILIP